MDHLASVLDDMSIWVALDRMSDEAKISTNWVTNDGQQLAEIPWSIGYPINDDLKQCGFINVTSNGYINY